jgi:ribulose-5-phosphate 4-epimerase/fuculose-1-phosphate aldolase
MPESVMTLGEVPVVSADEIVDADTLQHTSLLAVKPWGLFLWGRELATTFYLLERLEYTAKIAHLASKMKACTAFSPQELSELQALSASLGIQKLGLDPNISWKNKSGFYKHSFQLHKKVRSEREFVSLLAGELA